MRDGHPIRWDLPAPMGAREQAKPPIGVPHGRQWVYRSPSGWYLSLIASIDDGRWHVSVAHSQRYPTWDEIRAVRDWGFPDDMEVVMVLPRKVDYVNVHPNCFHLYQSACGKESA